VLCSCSQACCECVKRTSVSQMGRRVSLGRIFCALATLTVMTFWGQHDFTYTMHFVEIHVVDSVVCVIFFCECNKGISAVLGGYE